MRRRVVDAGLASDERGAVGCDDISSGKYISQHSVKTRKIQFVLFSLFQDIPFNRKGRQRSVVSGTVSRVRDTRFISKSNTLLTL